MGLTQTDFLQIYDRIFILNNATLKIPEPVLAVHMAQGALQSLDPHTTIIWPNQIPNFEKDMTGEFSGIGIEIIKPQGKLTVASLLPDTPAYRAGLDAGDIIIKIDGVPTRDMSLHCAVKRITGPKGTPVQLTIQREDAEGIMDLTIVRDTIDVPMIRGWQRTTSGQWKYIIDPQSRIAHVRIMSFSSPRVASDFDRVLKNLEKDGLNGLILDLRSNMGGHLDKAVSLVDMFVKQGMIVQTKPGLGYTRVPTTEWAHRRGTHPDYPLVILINSVSASASEIVAGALADPKHERAILVGERTHGKGSVQSIFSRGLYGAELKCTMAYYHLPSGQRVNTRDAMEKQGRRDWGVAPDVQLVLRSDEARALWDIQKENDVLVQANNSHQKQSKKHSIEDLLEVDHQLAVGLLLVKAKLIEKGGPLLATN
jgi:carboxyl-terminal processing protease